MLCCVPSLSWNKFRDEGATAVGGCLTSLRPLLQLE